MHTSFNHPVIRQPLNREADPSCQPPTPEESRELADHVYRTILPPYYTHHGRERFQVPTSEQIANLYTLTDRIDPANPSRLRPEFGSVALLEGAPTDPGEPSAAHATGSALLAVRRETPWLLTDSSDGSLVNEAAVLQVAQAADEQHIPASFQTEYQAFCEALKRSPSEDDAATQPWSLYQAYQQCRYDLHKVMQAYERHVSLGLQPDEVTAGPAAAERAATDVPMRSAAYPTVAVAMGRGALSRAEDTPAVPVAPPVNVSDSSGSGAYTGPSRTPKAKIRLVWPKQTGGESGRAGRVLGAKAIWYVIDQAGTPEYMGTDTKGKAAARQHAAAMEAANRYTPRHAKVS